MRIAVLSRNPRLYSTSRLVATAERRGHTVDVLDPIACMLVISRRSHELFHRGERLAVRYDAVVPRIGASITDYGLAVLGHFERDQIPVLNSAAAIARSRDKLRALQLLSMHDVGIPRTAIAREASAIRGAILAVGGAPVILKLVQGTQGVGVMIAESAEGGEAIFDTLSGLGQNIILQEFIQESRGRDVRALVVGGEVVAAMRRTARAGEFRSNLHRGGAGVAVDLAPDYTAAAVAAATIMGLEAAGVDMLESLDGPRVIEVNSSPGLRGIERATGIDVADRMVARVEAIGQASRR